MQALFALSESFTGQLYSDISSVVINKLNLLKTKKYI